MVTRDSAEGNILTKVARTVGSALGNAAAKASEVAETMQREAPVSDPKDKKHRVSNNLQQKVRERQKSKRAKHKRKLGRKTAG